MQTVRLLEEEGWAVQLLEGGGLDWACHPAKPHLVGDCNAKRRGEL